MQNSLFEKYLLVATSETVISLMVGNALPRICEYYSYVSQDQKKDIVKLMTYRESALPSDKLLGIVNQLFGEPDVTRA